MDIGAIPNMPFAKVLNRGTCNLALQALYGHTARGVVERDLCRQFYEVILRIFVIFIFRFRNRKRWVSAISRGCCRRWWRWRYDGGKWL